jgi:hypothetical protein
MTALSADKKRRRRNLEALVLGEALPDVSTTFYQGGLLAFNAADALVKASATDALRIAGVMPSALVTTGSVSAKQRFEFGHEEWFAHSGISAGAVGKDAFVLDDATVTTGPGGSEDGISYVKAAHGAAGTTTAETVIGHVNFACKIIAARYVPAAALTADNTNNATITVSKRVAGGGSKTTIASITTNVASGNWTQWAPKDLTLTAVAADLQIAANSGITFEIAKGGTGVVVPAGTLELVFSVGTQIRAGEIKGFETFDGAAGVWIAVARFSGRDA